MVGLAKKTIRTSIALRARTQFFGIEDKRLQSEYMKSIAPIIYSVCQRKKK